MIGYKIIIQDPFEQQERVLVAPDTEAVLHAFERIDWARLSQEIYTRHDEMLHDFYFFEVQAGPEELRYQLTISVMLTPQSVLQEQGPLFTVRHNCPDTARPGKTADFTKEDCPITLVRQCLQQLTGNDPDALRSVFEAEGRSSSGCLGGSVAVLMLIMALYAFLLY